MIFYPFKCIGCGRCVQVCPTGAAQKKDISDAKELCENCGNCVKVCPSIARQMMGKYMGVEEVLEEVKKDTRFYRRSGGGITITGGEPLRQDDFVANLLKRCKQIGIHTAIETCGYSRAESLEKVLKYVDLVLFDLKHMDSRRHKELTGVGNELILQNATIIAKTGKKIVFRVPVIPGYNDDEKNIKEIAAFVSGLNNAGEVHLIPYHRLGESKYTSLGRKYPLTHVKTLDKDCLQVQNKIIEEYNLKVQLGG